ncbi:MAG: shikimate dehydrogenase family protein [Bacteroidota bacterium]
MKHPLLLGLLGFPLGHSSSPALFGTAFERAGLDAEYRCFEYRDYPGLLRLGREHSRLLGLNVTLPYKKSVFQEIQNSLWNGMKSELTPEALGCGAVNCLGFRRSPLTLDPDAALEGFWGHNTDVEGFVAALDELCHNGVDGPALVLGNGGAAAAVIYGLQLRRIPFGVVTRSLSPSAPYPQFLWSALDRATVAQHPLIIQCTPLGMEPQTDQLPPLDLQGLGSHHAVMDLVYRPQQTRFLEECQQLGARTLGGLSMFRIQAEASLRFWSQLPGGEALRHPQLNLIV